MHNPNSRHIGRMLTAMGLAAVMMTGTNTQAQTRSGSDGRALDANRQVGSGGVNPADGQLDFSRRNDVITGNVGGGRGFQDTIDYRAVGEFGDTLDSDSLFDFRRQSLPSSTNFLNATSIGGGPNSNIRVFRSYTNRAAQPLSPGLTAPQGGGNQISSASALTKIYSTQIRTDAFSGSGVRLENGLSLRAFSQAPGTGLDRAPIVTSSALTRKLSGEALEANKFQISGEITDSMRYDTNLFDPLIKPDKDQLDKQNIDPGQLPPTMLLGQQLQTLIDPGDAGMIDPNRSQLVLDSVFQRLDAPNAKPKGDSVYDQLLRDIRDGGDKEVTGGDALANSLEAPTSQQLTEAELAYDQIMKDMYGEDYKDRRKNLDTEEGAEATDEQVRGVVDQLNYDLPRLETLAGDKQTRIADLTREAETALANGKYLTAESRYRQILLRAKDDPLPRVGLVHAQLGAGMFRSAGTNLRALFVQHPELIAARYDVKLLPPESRLQWIQQELQTVIHKGEGGKNAPLLLAYLGYQADSRQLVRYGIALAQSKSPRDPLLLVIREIWLDESDTSDGE